MGYLFKNLENIILYASLLGVCLLRISVAGGNVFFGIALLGFIFWCFNKKVNPYNLLQERLGKKVLLSYGLFLTCFIPSVLLSDTHVDSFKQILEMFVFRVVPFVIVVVTVSSKDILEKLLMGILVIEIVDCCVALYQSFVLNVYHAYGFSFHYLNLAGLLAFVLPIVTVMALDSSFSPSARRLASVAFIVMAVCAIAGNKSRALWLIVFTVIPFIAICYRRVLWKHKSVLIVALISLSLAAGFFISSEKNMKRLESVTNTTTNGSNVSRIYMWKSCLKMMEDYPVGGVGLGNYKRYYDNYYEMAAVPKKGYGHPHNSYLHLGAQAGLPGFLAIVIATGLIIYSSLKNNVKKENVYYYLLAVSWLGFGMFGVVEPIIDSTVHVKFISLLSGIFCAGLYLDGLGKVESNV